MSTVDDPQFLLRHLRTCFITSDDSGLCELLVEPDLIRDNRRQRSGSKLSSNSGSEPEISVSPDITSDMDYGGGRARSHTALRIEKIKQEKTKRSKVKSVKWRHHDMKTAPDEAILEEMFKRKEIIPRDNTKLKSSLTALLKQNESVDPKSVNSFDEYKQFDGETHAGMPNKSIEIYMTMEKATSKLLPIIVLNTATVQQTIGVACWKYTNQKRQPSLVEDMTSYSLHMTEDDGEVDDDFPALDSKEPISKFGFTRLALVMKAPSPPLAREPPPAQVRPPLLPAQSVDPSTRAAEPTERRAQLRQRKTTTTAPALDKRTQLVTIHIPEHGSTKLLVDINTVTVGQLLKMVLERRNMGILTTETFQLGNEFNQKLDSEMLIDDTHTREFYMTSSRTALVGTRPMSVIDGNTAELFPDMDTDNSLLVAQPISPRPRSAIDTANTRTYSVNLIAKLFSNIPVILVISPGGLEIQPTKSTLKSMYLNKTMETEIDAASLLACAVTKSRSSGKTQFNLHFNAGESQVRLQQHSFEALEPVANEVVTAINDLINKCGQLPQPQGKQGKQRRQSSFY